MSDLQSAPTRDANVGPRAGFDRVNVCVNCRTLLGPNESCDGGARHRIAELRSKAGRSMLLDEVWGPPSIRRRAKQLAKAGGSGLGIGSLFEGCGGGCDGCGSAAIDGEALAVIGVILLVAVAVVGVVWLVMKLIEWIRAYQNRPKPNGGVDRPASIGRRPGPTGTVVGRTAALAPATGTQCVAWAIDLRSDRFLRTDLMLHDAETCGFDVKLDDGSVARIPRGRIRMEGPHKRIDRDNATNVKEFVQTLAQPDDPEDAGLDPFPFSVIDEVVLRPGDRIRLFGELDREMDPNAMSGYRDAKALLVPRGVPALKIDRS